MYKRVIPRDLFNEGNLLKCYGQLYIELEKLGMENNLLYDNATGAFCTYQFSEDGSLTLLNVALVAHGSTVKLVRPLNSRQPYPLWAYPNEEREIQVFDDSGRFTPDMLSFLKEKK